MIGLCRKCGFMGDSPPKTANNRDAWAKLWKRCAWGLAWRLDCEQHGHKEAVKAWNRLEKENKELRIKLLERDARLDDMLEILMAQTEAKRMSVISKLKKKRNVSGILKSIRKANGVGL